MADETAKFESAQALFCAIADGVGNSKIDKVLNLVDFPTYKDFANGYSDRKKAFRSKTNRERITEAATYLDTTTSLSDIESFLTKDKGWYTSSVLIAKKLINDLAQNVDEDFASLKRKGFLTGNKKMYYVRGDSEVMGTIEKLFKIANNNNQYLKLAKQTKFGDVNKWSPADIYYCSEGAKKEITDHFASASKNASYNFDDLNKLISEQIHIGKLLPLSLKKQTKTVILEKVNFDIKLKDKVIDGEVGRTGQIVGGLWYGGRRPYKKWNGSIVFGSWHMPRQIYSPFEPLTAQDKKNAPVRDIKIKISGSQDRSSEKGEIQMRHDASGSGTAWKVDFSYTSSEARGGSTTSWKTFIELLSLINPTVAKNADKAWKEGQEVWKEQMKSSYTNPAFDHKNCCPGATPQGLEKHKKMIQGDWKKQYTRGLNQTKTSTLFPSGGTAGRPSPYSDLRGEVATIAILNRVGPVIVNWLDSPEANVIPRGYTTNQVDRFIRLLFKYVTSQSVSSGQFVIAK